MNANEDHAVEGVAIIGMAGRFPGARNVAQFWQNLRDGVESVTFFSDDELLKAGIDAETVRNPEYVKARGVLDGVEMFDAAFFGLTPREAELMDPQHRLVLECAWEALEDAGCDPQRYLGPIGVFAGVSMNTYLLSNLCADRQYIEQLVVQHQLGAFPVFLGNDKDCLATRVSYKLNLKGPSLTIQTACSTSLVAIHQACQSLLYLECKVAIAGGVSISFPQQRGYLFQEGAMGSADGHCRAFDAKAQGVAFGGGVALVVLKRVEDALAEGDQIYAVIRGSAINNDGASKVSFTAPSIDAQAEVVAMAQAVASTPADTITYVEAHGTGTPLGDPIEVAALTRAFRSGTSAVGFCGLGSVKSNVGHLEHAAGATSLIKTAMALRHRVVPASLHFETPNPNFDFAASPFYVNNRLSEWPSGATPRRAGVSAFGVGGTNAHVVVEEAPAVESLSVSTRPQLVVLSAKTPSALDTATRNLASFLRDNQALNLADVAYTLQVGRRMFEHRRTLVVNAIQDASDALASLDSSRIRSGRAGERPPGVVFAFPGQGSQFVGMGTATYELEPVFREQVDTCAEILRPKVGLDIRRLIYPSDDEQEEAARLLNDTAFTQPALFVIEYALAQLWMSWGVRPVAMVGHSVAEFVAACLAGVFPLESALRLVTARGRLMQDLPRGSMLVVRLPENELVRSLPPELALAAVNAPSLCVVSGPSDTVVALERELTARGVITSALATSHAFHSPMMEPITDRFADEVSRTAREAPGIPFVSTLTGTWITDREATDPEYWARQLRQTVRFGRAAQTLLEEPGRAILEVGPGTTLTSLCASAAATGKGHVLVPSWGDRRRAIPDGVALKRAVGQLWLAGCEIDWPKLHGNERRRRLTLPTYPFERRRCWVDPPRPGEPASRPPILSGTSIGDSSPEAYAVPEEAPMPDSTSLASRVDTMLRAVRSLFGELAGMEPSEIDPASTFLDLGFDSLFLTQATQALQKTFSVKITFRQLLGDLSTPAVLADYLARRAPADVLAASALAPTAAGPARVPIAPAASIAGPPVGAGSLEGLIAQQLQTMAQLMAQQLEAVRAGAPAAAASGPSAELPRAAPTPPMQQPSQAAAASRDAAPAKAEFSAFGPYKPIDKGQGGAIAADQEQHLADLVRRYTARTKGSKASVQADRAMLADPRVAAGFRAKWKEMVYPIVTSRAKGSRLWDVDGNEYIDILNGFGCIMFGHSPDFVTEAVARQLGLGMEIGPQTLLAGRAARLICELTGNERATFCNTGSEAVMASLRLARTVTGRDKIALFAGSYHGTFDEVLVKGIKGRSGTRSMPIAPGIPNQKVENVLVLDYGKPESLDILRANVNDLAAVLVEPVQSRRPELQPREFLHEVRRLTEQAGTALIFDEVVTGFRVHPGGMQAVFGIRADLATYGKVIAGGMPIGVLAGKATYMDALDGGQWRYGDDSVPEAGVTFFAGTFVRHPLALAAVNAALDHLKAGGPELQFLLNQRTRGFVDTLNAVFDEREVPLHASHCGSILYLHFAPDVRFGSLLYYHLRLRGVHVQEGFPCFLTTAHSDEDLAKVVDAFKESIDEMQAGAFLPAPSGKSIDRPPAQVQAPARTTEAQKEIFLACQMGDEAACAYNDSLTVRLRGPLQVGALLASIRALPVQHSALRSRFSADGESFTVDERPALEMPLVDLSHLPEPDRERGYATIVEEQNRIPFDLNTGPLVRARLVRTDQGDHRLLLMAHHIVCDGWSFVVLLQDLSVLYTSMCHGTNTSLPAAMSFADYSSWERERMASEEYEKAEAYWLKQFAEPVPSLELPTDRTRPAVRTYTAGLERVLIDAEVYRAVKRVGARGGCTQFTTMLAAFMVLLLRLTGEEDVVVAVPAAGQSVVGRDELVGHCANLLPVRGRPAETATFSSFLAGMRQTVLDAYEHQSYTYGTLVSKLSIPRDPSRQPLLSAMFNIDRAGFKGLELAGLQTDLITNPKASVIFDLNFNIIETDLGLELNCDYNAVLFDGATIRGWLQCFRALLASVAADPEQSLGSLPILTDTQQRELLESWNKTDIAPSDACIHTLFEGQSHCSPDARAVACGDRTLAYGDLNGRANRLAHHLRHLGVGAESLVGIYLDRSLEMVVALLGVLKAGGAYVPLDPAYPAERIALVLEDSAAALVLTTEALLPTLADYAGRIVCLDRDWPEMASESASDPDLVVTPSNLAYVIYTSGSTGGPKGVEVTHGNVVNFLRSMAREPGFTSADTLMAVTTLSFDIAGLELFLPLVEGGQVVVAHRDETLDGGLLADSLERCGATVMQATPATWQLLLQADWSPKRPIKILCGGEALTRDLANRLLERGSELWNMYGPTETTIWSSVARIEPGNDPIVLGHAVDNTQIYTVNSHLQLTPPGVPGELLIGGHGVARGYWRQPALTAEKFLASPFGPQPDSRVYRTGDLVRRRPNGDLVFLGRLDTQVKVRGFRIELGEVEFALRAHPEVDDSVVLAREDVPGDKRLVAYVVRVSGANGHIVPRLRAYLAEKLPPHMVPSTFVLLDAFPRTPNGKIDRRTLPAPDAKNVFSGVEFIAPRTPEEQTLARIWKTVLRLDKVGVNDSVFDLGADSLLIFQITARARQAGLSLRPAQVFEHRTIAALASMMRSAPAPSSDGPAISAVSRDSYRRKRSTP